jgi:FMN-dependent NADH-azoreductase
MKRALIINGSYRTGGDTDHLIGRFVQGLRESLPDAEIETVRLEHRRIEYCRGCWTCADPENRVKPIGACPIGDDVRELLEKSLACDILVYASPVYEMGPTALMKKFLERNLPVVGSMGLGFKGRAARMPGKRGVVLLSSGAPYPINVLWGFIRYPRRLLRLFCRFHGCDSISVLPAGGMGANERLRAHWGDRAHALGRKTAGSRTGAACARA